MTLGANLVLNISIYETHSLGKNAILMEFMVNLHVVTSHKLTY